MYVTGEHCGRLHPPPGVVHVMHPSCPRPVEPHMPSVRSRTLARLHPVSDAVHVLPDVDVCYMLHNTSSTRARCRMSPNNMRTPPLVSIVRVRRESTPTQ
jgi:hypothetical protein